MAASFTKDDLAQELDAVTARLLTVEAEPTATSAVPPVATAGATSPLGAAEAISALDIELSTMWSQGRKDGTLADESRRRLLELSYRWIKGQQAAGNPMTEPVLALHRACREDDRVANALATGPRDEVVSGLERGLLAVYHALLSRLPRSLRVTGPRRLHIDWAASGAMRWDGSEPSSEALPAFRVLARRSFLTAGRFSPEVSDELARILEAGLRDGTLALPSLSPVLGLTTSGLTVLEEIPRGVAAAPESVLPPIEDPLTGPLAELARKEPELARKFVAALAAAAFHDLRSQAESRPTPGLASTAAPAAKPTTPARVRGPEVAPARTPDAALPVRPAASLSAMPAPQDYRKTLAAALSPPAAIHLVNAAPTALGLGGLVAPVLIGMVPSAVLSVGYLVAKYGREAAGEGSLEELLGKLGNVLMAKSGESHGKA